MESIKSYLKRNKITIAALHRITQIPYTTISELVNGKVDINRVYVGTAIKLALACNLSFEEFYQLCAINTETLNTPNTKIIVKNKKYYLLYEQEGKNVLSPLFRVNETNKRFVKDAAEWEKNEIESNYKNALEMAEVESWSANDII